MTHEELDKLVMRTCPGVKQHERLTVIVWKEDFEALLHAARDSVSPTDDGLDERIRQIVTEVVTEQVPSKRAMSLDKENQS